MCCASIRSSRTIIEECLKWASQRYVFGKPLLAQAVIRWKFAQMIAKVEALQAWLENVTYQMCNMASHQTESGGRLLTRRHTRSNRRTLPGESIAGRCKGLRSQAAKSPS